MGVRWEEDEIRKKEVGGRGGGEKRGWRKGERCGTYCRVVP